MSYSKAKGEGLRKFESNVEFETGADGQAVWKNGKRSSFESQSAYLGGREFSDKSFSKREFDRKSWSANKQYASQKYEGHLDGSKFQRSPHFANKQAQAQGVYTQHGGKSFGTTAYNGASKQADRGRAFQKFEDTETNIRRKVFVPPPIQSNEEYNGLSLSETKYLMGR